MARVEWCRVLLVAAEIAPVDAGVKQLVCLGLDSLRVDFLSSEAMVDRRLRIRFSKNLFLFRAFSNFINRNVSI